MYISASIQNKFNQHNIQVSSDGSIKQLAIASKANGYGSSVNGAEFLLLALATCFCNDIYREAAKRQINITEVEVLVTGEFGNEGEPGSNFQYKANIVSDATAAMVDELLTYTDGIAEIQNTLRRGLDIRLIK